MESLTVTYKSLEDGSPIYMDIFIPSPGTPSEPLKYPLVLYFHGGGFAVGDRSSWMPVWLRDRCLAKGYIFASADYRLLPPTTGHQVLEDIQDAFAFVSCFSYDRKGGTGKVIVDSGRIAVAGTSAGGLCAYLAAKHCKPAAILSMYGMGGNFFTQHYLLPKKVPFFRGRELLDPADFPQFLYPESARLPVISGSPLAYHDASYHIPGYPANPRMLLARLYLQLGTFLDYWTGLHEPSISGTLRRVCEEDAQGDEMDFEDLVPEQAKHLFPQLNAMSTAWPPTLLVHGTQDTAVPVSESAHMFSKLSSAGALVRLIEVKGMEHSFDYEAGAEAKCASVFEEVIQFLAGRLGRAEEADKIMADSDGMDVTEA